MSADTYPGDQSDPLSLNLYVYCSNNPVAYKDPTGYWQQGDEQYSLEIQTKLIALTQAYYDAKTDADREEVHNLASQIREENKNNQNKLNANAISSKLNDIYYTEKSYTEETWNETLKDSNIVVKKNPATAGNDYLAYKININTDFFYVEGGYYGGSQSWYTEKYKQNSGCGPTAAANILTYYMINGKMPNDYTSVYKRSPTTPTVKYDEFVNLLNIMYDKVPQSIVNGLGVWTMESYMDGISNYMSERGINANGKILSDEYYGTDQAASFIAGALMGKNPVALLLWQSSYTNTYHEGTDNEYTQNYSRHFMTITGMSFDVKSSTYDVIISTWGQMQILRNFGDIWEEDGVLNRAWLSSFNPVKNA